MFAITIITGGSQETIEAEGTDEHALDLAQEAVANGSELLSIVRVN